MSWIDDHLVQAYRRDVLRKPYHMPRADPKHMPEIKARIAQIDAQRLGASLASRDFVSYQNRKALARLLAEMEAQAGKKP